MKKTRKLAAISLICLILISSIFFVSCRKEPIYQDTHQHIGMVSCEICGLNYFDEVKSLVLENGTINNMGQYYYRQKNQSTWVCYSPSDMSLSLGLNYNLDGGSYDFTILIPSPSKDNSMQTGIYSWALFLSIGSTMGTINGNTFSPFTDELTLTYYHDNLNYIVGAIPSLCARFAKDTINNAFIPLLMLSKKNITPKNFGFANFSL